MLGNQDGGVEFTRLSSIRFAGMEFCQGRWVVLNLCDDHGPRLVHLQSMVHAVDDAQGGRPIDAIFFKTFHFGFKQLKAEVKTNQIRISVKRLQQLLDECTTMFRGSDRPANVVDFAPVQCGVRGLWPSEMDRFNNWTEALICRTIHFSKATADELIFIYR